MDQTARPSSAAVMSPSVVVLLSDSDCSPSPSPRDLAACRQTGTVQQQPAAPLNCSTAVDAAMRQSSIDLDLANMVDLLSDDDADEAPVNGGDRGNGTAFAFAGQPSATAPRRSTSARRIRKPARFADTDDTEPASPPGRSRSGERPVCGSDGGGGGGSAYQWPSPPEDSFINDDGPAESLPISACDFPDPSPSTKRCVQ